jgi:hypothetical protein
MNWRDKRKLNKIGKATDEHNKERVDSMPEDAMPVLVGGFEPNGDDGVELNCDTCNRVIYIGKNLLLDVESKSGGRTIKTLCISCAFKAFPEQATEELKSALTDVRKKAGL